MAMGALEGMQNYTLDTSEGRKFVVNLYRSTS